MAGLLSTGSSNVFLGFGAGIYETGSNKLYIANSNSGLPLVYGEFDNKLLYINGNFRATGTSVASDKRWKTDILPLRSALDKVSGLEGVTYQWKLDEFPDQGLKAGRQIGLIAQDVETVLPELVESDGDGYKSICYSKLTAVLVEAVKELKQKNEKQQDLLKKQQDVFARQLEQQQALIEKLSAMIADLKG